LFIEVTGSPFFEDPPGTSLLSLSFGGVPVMFEFGCTNENGGDNSGAVIYLGSFCGLMTFYPDEPLAYLNKRRLDLMTINFVGGGDDSFYSYYCFNLTILD
jgi:hypothetical protein